MKFNKRYLIILAILVTEVLGFSLILPFLPFYAQELGASPFQIGLILASFSFFQFFSAPIMGRLSDCYGRRPLLILSQLSTFLGFIILGLAGSLKMIVLSRVVDGLLGSNYTIAQAYLSDISTKKDRSKAFGISGVAFGVGFLFGPALGGYLSRFGYSVPSFLAAGVALITVLLTLILLPETVQKRTKFCLDIKVLKLGEFKKYFSQPKISRKLWIFWSYISAHVVWVSSFALYAEKQLGLNASQVGLILAFIGLINIILRGVLLGKIIDLVGEEKLKYTGVILIIIALLGASGVKNYWLFLPLLTFFALGNAFSRPLLLGEISRSVSAKEQGIVMGLTNSLGSISQIIGPLLGGFLINYFFPGSLGIAAGLLMVIGLLLMVKNHGRSTF